MVAFYPAFVFDSALGRSPRESRIPTNHFLLFHVASSFLSLGGIMIATSSVAHVINFVFCLAGARLLWLLPDEYLAHCVIAAFPTRQYPLPPTGDLGRAAKIFLSATLLFWFTQANLPPLGQILPMLWSLIEGTLCWFWGFVWQTIWNAWN